MDEPIDPVNVSALNQYTYCPRRCALIYVDGEFQNNIHTERGNAEHARVDRASHASSKAGARIEYALPIWSDALGLIGKCDVVEFWPDGTLYPVEYKHGKRHKHINDDLQLTAQAMCLEEMFDRPVEVGAIFHAGSKRRREVKFTEASHAAVQETIHSIRSLVTSGSLPLPVNDQRCPECSMRDICQPQTIATQQVAKDLAAHLFDDNAS